MVGSGCRVLAARFVCWFGLPRPCGSVRFGSYSAWSSSAIAASISAIAALALALDSLAPAPFVSSSRSAVLAACAGCLVAGRLRGRSFPVALSGALRVSSSVGRLPVVACPGCRRVWVAPAGAFFSHILVTVKLIFNKVSFLPTSQFFQALFYPDFQQLIYKLI